MGWLAHARHRFNAGFCDVPSLAAALQGEVAQPTLVCVGDQANGGGPEGGGTSAAAAARFVAGTRNAQAVVVTDAKRLLPWQNPAALADALADFLQEAA